VVQAGFLAILGLNRKPLARQLEGGSSHRLLSERIVGFSKPNPLYETIIVKLIFDLLHLLVRPAGDYLVVPT
jgi:hypothetical protein